MTCTPIARQAAPCHVVMFSGGLGSWEAAKRVAAAHGTANLKLLFADTRMEDADLYRFLHEAAANVGGELVILADGRTPWQVFRDERFLGNSRVDPCSKILKRQMADAWVQAHYSPDSVIRHVGIDWTEEHRIVRLRERLGEWRVEAPLCEPPYLTKQRIMEHARAEGLKIPRLYELGFAHNNCGGFCVKAGQAHFAHLLNVLPEVYAYHEQKEQELRVFLGREDIAILRDRSGGETKPLTLRDFRQRLTCGFEFDREEWGGCGCFVEVAD